MKTSVCCTASSATTSLGAWTWAQSPAPGLAPELAPGLLQNAPLALRKRPLAHHPHQRTMRRTMGMTRTMPMLLRLSSTSA